MSKENRNTPDWPRQERQGDLAWIGENLSALAFVSQLAYADAGRGALFIDVGVQPLSEPVQLFGYLAQLDVERVADEDTVGLQPRRRVRARYLQGAGALQHLSRAIATSWVRRVAGLT
jgi:hypothetical protein